MSQRATTDDITRLAARHFHVPLGKVTPVMRAHIKTILHAGTYGSALPITPIGKERQRQLQHGDIVTFLVNGHESPPYRLIAPCYQSGYGYINYGEDKRFTQVGLHTIVSVNAHRDQLQGSSASVMIIGDDRAVPPGSRLGRLSPHEPPPPQNFPPRSEGTTDG